MRSQKQCIFCNKTSFIRKNRGTCTVCIKKISKFKMAIRGSIFNSIKYDTKSYIWRYLPYSVSELKNHLEKQFEPWMNWNNWGKYNSAIWDDNDMSTWTWQIDHIIPQANFIFTSVVDTNFIDCWSLENLRPLASKKNINKNIKENYEIKRMGR